MSERDDYPITYFARNTIVCYLAARVRRSSGWDCVFSLVLSQCMVEKANALG